MPYGVLLSGGLDSSLVASVCKREHDKLGSGEMLRQAEHTHCYTFVYFINYLLTFTWIGRPQVILYRTEGFPRPEGG